MSEQSKKYSVRAGTKICIPWTRQDWNEACAQAIEMFGLPNDRYASYPGERGMEFYFKDEKDAILFELCCG